MCCRRGKAWGGSRRPLEGATAGAQGHGGRDGHDEGGGRGRRGQHRGWTPGAPLPAPRSGLSWREEGPPGVPNARLANYPAAPFADFLSQINRNARYSNTFFLLSQNALSSVAACLRTAVFPIPKSMVSPHFRDKTCHHSQVWGVGSSPPPSPP